MIERTKEEMAVYYATEIFNLRAEIERLATQRDSLMEACRYTLDMLLQVTGSGETVGSQIGMVGGFRSFTLLNDALAKCESIALGDDRAVAGEPRPNSECITPDVPVRAEALAEDAEQAK